MSASGPASIFDPKPPLRFGHRNAIVPSPNSAPNSITDDEQRAAQEVAAADRAGGRGLRLAGGRALRGARFDARTPVMKKIRNRSASTTATMIARVPFVIASDGHSSKNTPCAHGQTQL